MKLRTGKIIGHTMASPNQQLPIFLREEIGDIIAELNHYMKLSNKAYIKYEKNCSGFINAPVTIEDILNETHEDALNVVNQIKIICDILDNIVTKEKVEYYLNTINEYFPDFLQIIVNFFVYFYPKLKILHDLYNGKDIYQLFFNDLTTILMKTEYYIDGF